MAEAADADEADEDMDEDVDEDELADDLLSLSGDDDYDDDEELHSLDSFYSGKSTCILSHVESPHSRPATQPPFAAVPALRVLVAET